MGQKARRMRKIKSRNFHRHLKKREKKEKEKNDNSDNEDEDEEKKLKSRAEERATLKHASTGSNWSKGNKRIKFKDQDMINSINEQAQIREKLKERTQFDEEDELHEEIGNE